MILLPFYMFFCCPIPHFLQSVYYSLRYLELLSHCQTIGVPSLLYFVLHSVIPVTFLFALLYGSCAIYVIVAILRAVLRF